MSVAPFRLPRLHLPGVHPKAIAAQEVNAPRALDGWERGFSLAAALDYVEQVGVTLPTRPVDPDMPADITALTSGDLGTLYGQFVAYTGWLETEVSLSEISADEEQSHQDHVEAETILKKAGTVKDKTSKAINDPKYVEAEKQALIAKARAKLLRARLRSYERCCGALSREMSRRLGEAERTA